MTMTFRTENVKYLTGNEITLKNIRFFSFFCPHMTKAHGILSIVLKSERAVQVNIQIMRAVTKPRKMLSTQEGLRKKSKPGGYFFS